VRNRERCDKSVSDRLEKKKAECKALRKALDKGDRKADLAFQNCLGQKKILRVRMRLCRRRENHWATRQELCRIAHAATNNNDARKLADAPVSLADDIPSPEEDEEGGESANLDASADSANQPFLEDAFEGED